MSRLYFGVETNLHPSDDEHPTPQIENIVFINPVDKVIVSVEGIDCSWGVDDNNILSGRWKDTRVSVYNYETKEQVHDWEMMSEKDFELLRYGFIKKVSLSFDVNCTYGWNFVPAFANMDISLEFNDHVKYWRKNVIPVETVES